MSAIALFRGTVVSVPELQAIQNGKSMCRFRIATKSRYRDERGEWQNPKNPVFLEIRAFGEIAEAIYPSVSQGDRIAGSGQLEQYASTSSEGVKRRTTFVVASDPVHVLTHGRGTHGPDEQQAENTQTSSHNVTQSQPGVPVDYAVSQNTTMAQAEDRHNLWDSMGSAPS